LFLFCVVYTASDIVRRLQGGLIDVTKMETRVAALEDFIRTRYRPQLWKEEVEDARVLSAAPQFFATARSRQVTVSDADAQLEWIRGIRDTINEKKQEAENFHRAIGDLQFVKSFVDSALRARNWKQTDKYLQSLQAAVDTHDRLLRRYGAGRRLIDQVQSYILVADARNDAVLDDVEAGVEALRHDFRAIEASLEAKDLAKVIARFSVVRLRLDEMIEHQLLQVVDTKHVFDRFTQVRTKVAQTFRELKSATTPGGPGLQSGPGAAAGSGSRLNMGDFSTPDQQLAGLLAMTELDKIEDDGEYLDELHNLYFDGASVEDWWKLAIDGDPDSDTEPQNVEHAPGPDDLADNMQYYE
jgi:hypothetical protein